MNPPITVQLAHADPNSAPLNINELIDIFNPLFNGAIVGSYIPYVIGSATPNVNDQDKAWMELDSGGRPIAIKIFYNGNWRRVYNGMLGEIRQFSGNPGNLTYWDANGHGQIGQIYDGWQICNGLNGSPDLTDRFIVAAHMNNQGGHVGYANGQWQTFIDGKSDLASGGSKDHMIQPSELPPFDSVMGSSKVTIHGFEAKESSPSHTNTSVLVDIHYADLGPHDIVVGNYGSGPNDSPPVPQTAIPTLPPFIALGLMIFQGY